LYPCGYSFLRSGYADISTPRSASTPFTGLRQRARWLSFPSKFSHVSSM